MDLAALTLLVLPDDIRVVGVEPVESFGRTAHAALLSLRERRLALVPGRRDAELRLRRVCPHSA